MPDIFELINLLPGGIAQGIIYGIMGLGIYITFKVLNESDMTVDGSFSTGAAVAIMLITNKINPYISIFAAFLSGCIAGLATGLIHTKLKIPAILSGILVQFGLYSINLHIMGNSSNVPCNPRTNHMMISSRDNVNAIIVGLVLAVIIIAILYWYFGTEQGCAIRATGNNSRMAKAQGININNMKVIGFILGNGLVALSGGINAQYLGFADINIGRGSIVIGLASIIIGEVLLDAIFKKGCSFYTRLAGVIVGGIIYYFVMIIILWLNINTDDLKLATAIIVMIFMAIPNLKKGVNHAKD